MQCIIVQCVVDFTYFLFRADLFFCLTHLSSRPSNIIQLECWAQNCFRLFHFGLFNSNMNTLKYFIDHLTPEFCVVEGVLKNYMVCLCHYSSV